MQYIKKRILESKNMPPHNQKFYLFRCFRLKFNRTILYWSFITKKLIKFNQPSNGFILLAENLKCFTKKLLADFKHLWLNYNRSKSESKQRYNQGEMFFQDLSWTNVNMTLDHKSCKSGKYLYFQYSIRKISL